MTPTFAACGVETEKEISLRFPSLPFTLRASWTRTFLTPFRRSFAKVPRPVAASSSLRSLRGGYDVELVDSAADGD